MKICADACLWEVEEVDRMGKIYRKQNSDGYHARPIFQ
jgi:hypothetical protein